jgi:hypothetical protein
MSILSLNINQQNHNDSSINVKDELALTLDGLMLVLALMAFFINPFYILILASIIQLYINFKSAYFLTVFTAALAYYWSNRNIGVTWDGGLDDAVGYIETFLLMQKEDIGSLFAKFISLPAGNEIAYALFVYIIRIFTNEQQVFLFFIYFTMLNLLTRAVSNINKRFCLLIVSLIFFGLGGFVEQAALHLFRATLSSLVLFLAISIYGKNKRMSYWIMLLACLVHLAAIPLVLVFLIISYMNIRSQFTLLIISFMFILTLKYLLGFIDISLIDASRAVYITEDAVGSIEQTVLLGVLLIMYLMFNRIYTNEVYHYSFFVTGLLFFVYAIMKDYTFIAGRYSYVTQLFTGLLLFHIIIKIRIKPIICALLFGLFVRKMIALNNSDFIKGAFENFSGIFSPITMLF